MRISLDRVLDELRHGARRLVRAPIFTLATVLTLALALGANVAIFTVVHRVVLNPLPYGASRSLVAIDHGFPSRNIASGVPLTSELYYQYLDRARTLDGLAVYRTDEITVSGDGVPERIRVAHTAASLAAILRVAPERGRWFTEDESALGALRVAVLSHGLWVRRYGRSAAVMGQRVTLDGLPATVVGVMPASFAFPDSRIAMIVKQGAVVAAVGTLAGFGTALAGSRVIESLLYAVSPRDPFVFGGAALTLFAIALLACWLPARRAALLDPLDALRVD